MQNVTVAIGMAPYMKPLIQLAVVVQEHQTTVRTYQPGRPGDMALDGGAVKAAGLTLNELCHPIDGC